MPIELNATGFRALGLKDNRIMVVPCPKCHTCILTEQQHLGQLHGGEIEETCKCGGFTNTVFNERWQPFYDFE